MTLTGVLIGPEVKAGLFLAQIVRAIDITQQRQLIALFIQPFLQLAHRLSQQILVRHGHHGHMAAKPLPNLLRAIARSVHNVFAGNIALLRMHRPLLLTLIPSHTRCGAEALNMTAEVPRALGKGLGQLRGVNIAIGGVKHPAREVMRLQERIMLLQVFIRAHLHIQALHAAHACHVFKFLHAFFRVRQANSARHPIVHGIVNAIAQLPVQLRAITLHIGNSPGGGEVRAVPGRVPGRARRQLILFHQNTIRPALQGQVVKRRSTNRTATNDDNTRMRGKSHKSKS